jgi:hypothetical protein
LLIPPYRVIVKAAHQVGKTHLAAGLISWWYDTFDPSIVLTTATTDQQVKDVLWKEVRVQRRMAKLGGFRGPKMPRLESSPDHFAFGFATNEPEAFQGHHGPHILIVFDEAVGVDRVFWETAESMFAGKGHGWLAIFNPTDISSQAFMEERTRNWHVVSLSCLEHPNIAEETNGFPPPYPSAIRYARLDTVLRQYSSPIPASDRVTGDVEWPPNSGQWLRPGPVAEARYLGRWPTQAINSVWAEAVWQKAETHKLEIPPKAVPEIGCDVARFGDDLTAIHARVAGVSVHHESHNGWSTSQTAGALKVLCGQLGDRYKCDPRKILVKVDDDGVGGGVVDQRGDYLFIGISAARQAFDLPAYPNLRSELWFATAELAKAGMITFARVPTEIRGEIRRQLMSPIYSLDNQGRRVVEKKQDTKERLGRSPDDADAVNLAYLCLPMDFQAGPNRMMAR